MTWLAVLIAGPLVRAAEVANSPQPLRYFNQVRDYDRKNDKMRDIPMKNWLNILPGGPPPDDDDVEEIQKAYDSEKKDALAFKPYVPAANGGGEFETTAKECGEAKQKECSPANFGGRTMCGRGVAMMIKCMSSVTGAGANCTGACGNGKDFVNCGKGQMEACAYTKIDPSDARCKQAGAVLSYAQSPTARGSVYGHVEFVCGNNRFCSVYREPHDRPWPRYPADACWFPKKAAGGTSKGN